MPSGTLYLRAARIISASQRRDGLSGEIVSSADASGAGPDVPISARAGAARARWWPLQINAANAATASAAFSGRIVARSIPVALKCRVAPGRPAVLLLGVALKGLLLRLRRGLARKSRSVLPDRLAAG